MVTKTPVNGVNVDQLFNTINAIKENPSLAKFQFRAKSEWVDGAHLLTSIKTFYGAGQEDISRTKPFMLDADEPPVLLGANQGPNAVEVALQALANCVGVGFVYNAAAQGIKIEKLEFTMEGDLDLHGFLGLSDKVRPGYQNIRMNCRVKSDAPREKLVELFEMTQKRSPVFDIISNPVQISSKLETD